MDVAAAAPRIVTAVLYSTVPSNTRSQTTVQYNVSDVFTENLVRLAISGNPSEANTSSVWREMCRTDRADRQTLLFGRGANQARVNTCERANCVSAISWRVLPPGAHKNISPGPSTVRCVMRPHSILLRGGRA